MKTADSFIGTKFGDMSQITVISHTGRSNNGHAIYNVKCDVCAKDTELYGDGVFEIIKNNLVGGAVPCGCAKSPRRNVQQFTVLINRVCKERNYNFNGFIGNKKVGNETKLNLFCVKHQHSWVTTSFKGLVMSGYGCPLCRNEVSSSVNMLEDEFHINEFFDTGSFVEGTIFCRSERKNLVGMSPFFKYLCPICRVDEYCVNNTCTGVFESHMFTMKKGQVACRCSKTYKFTEQQTRYKLHSVLSGHYKFIDFIGEYSDKKTKAVVNCSIHGDWKAAASSLINAGTRCPLCASGGFKSNLPAAVYVLRVVGDKEFTGYGISNFVDTRLQTHKRSLNKRGCSISEMEVFHTSGNLAKRTEDLLKMVFPRNPQKIAGFITEATHYYMYDDVVEFVDSQIDNQGKHEYSSQHEQVQSGYA